MSISASVIPMVASDISSAIDLLYHQKISLTINQVMWKTWPDEIVQKARIRSAMEGSMNSSSTKCYKVVENGTEEFPGVLVLTRRQPSMPNESKGTEKSADDEVKPNTPTGLDANVLEAVIAALDKISEGLEGVDHIEITALVVAPTLRRKGLGSKLMQVAFENAKTDHVPLVVCSEPQSNAFFTKLRFQDVKHHDMDLSEFAPPFSGFGKFRLAKMLWSPKHQQSE